MTECQIKGVLASQRGDNVGFLEILSLEKERLSSDLGEGVCEAVPEIELRRMPALAEIMERLAGEVRLLHGHWFDHYAHSAEQSVGLLRDFGAELTVDDDGEFDEIPGGDTAARRAANGLNVEFSVRLLR